MSKPLRLAIIGVGDVAFRDYLPEMARLGDMARIDLVCARTEGRARKAASEYNVPRWSIAWQDALGTKIDVVVNLTPAPAHGEINLALARAGKHFYTEKPFAKDVDEGARIAVAAQQSGATVVAAPSVMLFPQLRRAAGLLAEGRIGKVHTVRAHACTAPPPWQGYQSDPTPYFSADVGPLSDIGVYPLHAITGLLGEVVEVFAMSTRTRNSFVVQDGPCRGNEVPVEVDDNWQVLLRLADGVLASVQSNFCLHRFDGPELELAGELGTIAFSLLDSSQPLRIFEQAAGEWRDVPVKHTRAAGPDHVLGVEHLLHCIRDQSEPVANIAHAMHVMAIRAAAGLSAASGCGASVQTIPTTTGMPAFRGRLPLASGEESHG